MNSAKNLHALRQQRFAFPSAACPRKVAWGSALGLSPALPGHFRLYASKIAEAGVMWPITGCSWSFKLKLLYKNETTANKSYVCA